VGEYSKWALALVAPLLLTGCLLIPGKFESQLRLMNDGTYSFTYNGQMQMAEGDDKPMSSQPATMSFDPDEQRCSNQIDKETGEITLLPFSVEDYAEPVDGEPQPYSFEDRQCTAAELVEMEREYNEQMAMMNDDFGQSGNTDDTQKNAAMGSVFGGAVPGDDEGLKKFAAQLAKYDGWNKVEYMGDNLFEVEYAVNGNFDQMFAFPTIPGATIQFPFVQILRRSGGELEILTPAMAGPGGLAGAMGPMPMGGSSGESKTQPIDGTFTIVTDGDVLSNNTKDGLTVSGSTKNMRWKVDGSSGPDGSPRAIVKLAN
jgi:hypothetical protein